MPRTIEYLPVDDIARAERNPKEHDQATLAGSVERFGFIEPSVVDERTGRLISGHGRLDALIARRDAGGDPPEGVTLDDAGRWLAPLVRGWASANDAEANAALIALNRVGERGGWRNADLSTMLDELLDGPGVEGIGYDRDDLDDLHAWMEEEGTSLEFDADRAQGDDPTSGAYKEPTHQDRLQVYRDKATRSIVLDYSLTEYEKVARLASAARERHELRSNAEVVLMLLERDAE